MLFCLFIHLFTYFSSSSLVVHRSRLMSTVCWIHRFDSREKNDDDDDNDNNKNNNCRNKIQSIVNNTTHYNIGSLFQRLRFKTTGKYILCLIFSWPTHYFFTRSNVRVRRLTNGTALLSSRSVSRPCYQWPLPYTLWMGTHTALTWRDEHSTNVTHSSRYHITTSVHI